MYITIDKLIELGFQQNEPELEPSLWVIYVGDESIENDYQTQSTWIEVDFELGHVSIVTYDERVEENINSLYFHNIKTDDQLNNFYNLITNQL